MPFPDIDPIAFAIGPIVVRWYALAYLVGVALGAVYGLALIKRSSLWQNNTPPFKSEDWLDFGFWAVLGIIVGGRLGYVVFYNPTYFAANPLQILQTWDGGMSFHGGLLGLIVAMFFYAKNRNANFLSGLDLLAAVATLGLMLGRLSNFINGELYGRETNVPWAVVFPTGGPIARHPTQLYEAALEGLILFLIIRYVTHVAYGLRRPGFVAGVFGIGYGISRIIVETMRIPDAHIGYLSNGWLTIGMIYSLPMVLIGLVLIVFASRKQKML